MGVVVAMVMPVGLIVAMVMEFGPNNKSGGGVWPVGVGLVGYSSIGGVGQTPR